MSVLDRFRIDGRAALVTGGTRGFGREIALALAEAGASVALTAREPAQGEAVAKEVAAATGQKTLAVAGDVTRPDDVAAMVARTLDAFGKLDILVNNAGINIRGPIGELSESDWDQVIDTNLKGPWLVCRAAGEALRKGKWGRVVNVSSMLGEVSMPGRTPYASSKGGLTLLTRTLALEWAADGVNVNALCPGPFMTEINTPLLNDPEISASIRAKVPLGRWGDPAEIGATALFLASDASSFITGATLFVDGGYTAQ